MGARTRYDVADGVATITMDDGKVNAMSTDMLNELNGAFARAEGEASSVLLIGRDGIFSAGFDLNVIRSGGEDGTREMLHAGATLAERILGFPLPVVTACTGHAYPMGAFLMLAADRRLAADGPYRIGMNETAIGLTLPQFAIELARARLTPPYFHRAVTGDMYGPEEAVRAGFLDELVPAEALAERSLGVAQALTQIDPRAHRETKAKLRAEALRALRGAIESELQ